MTIQLSLVLSGDYSNSGNVLYFGNKYVMNVELSEISIDQQNNVVDGILSLRTIHLRRSTGNYKIVTTRKGRTPMITSLIMQTVARDSVFPQMLLLALENLVWIMSFSHAKY